MDTDAAASRARHIAERADSVRAMLDLREYARQRRRFFGGIFFLAVIAPNALRGILTPHVGATAGWVVCWTLILAIAAASLMFHRVRHLRLSAARAQMLCPRCRYVLREEGPNAWTACDDTLRRCPECAYAITDDVYAAAALPTVHERAQRTINRSRGSILALAITIAILCIPMVVVGVGGTALSTIIIGFVVCLAAFITTGSWFTWRLQRAMWREVAAWLDEPYCTACTEPLPPGPPDLPLAVCPACGGRTSPPAAIAQARDAARRLSR